MIFALVSGDLPWAPLLWLTCVCKDKTPGYFGGPPRLLQKASGANLASAWLFRIELLIFLKKYAPLSQKGFEATYNKGKHNKVIQLKLEKQSGGKKEEASIDCEM